MRRFNRNALSAVLLVGSLLLTVGTTLNVFPLVLDTQLVREGYPPSPSRLPLRDGPGLSGPFQVHLTLWLPAFHPTLFHITPDDCLERLTINGQPVPMDSPLCDYAKGHVLDLRDFLHAGMNNLQFSLMNGGGSAALRMRPAASDPAVLAVILCALLTVLSALYALSRWKPRLRGPLLALLFLGIALRLSYTWITPYDVRGYDWEGHHDYTQYILTHGAIPDPEGGWQFYQPPLAYALYAAFLLPLSPLRQSLSPETQQQIASLILSIITLCFGIAALARLFPRKADRPWFLLSSVLLATFPGLVMTSARVNNDVLFLTLAFIWLYLLLRFAVQPKWLTWIGLSVTLALGLLTKSTMAVPVAATFAWLPFATQIRWRGRVSLGLACAGVLLLVAGWFVIPRALQARDPDRIVVGNIRNLNGALRLDNEPLHLLSFQPAQILRHPYVDPWNDAERRRRFPEYWFKSAFFGEFHHGEPRRLLAQLILLLALLTLPLLPAGIMADVWDKRLRFALPLGLTMLAQVAAHVTLRLQAPYSSIQDFRYSLLLVIPALYFMIRGVTVLHSRLQYVARDALVISAFLWTAFLVSLTVV